MLSFTLAWIWICAYLNCAGWVLSALHQLNGPGYAATLVIGLGGWLWWQKNGGRQLFSIGVWHRLNRRFRRPFPLAFLILTGLAFLGGALYAPNNYDGLTYRLPRVLNWLADGQWHWIHSIFPRVNTRGCGMEWLSAPLIALTRTDRFLFLINIVSFLILPGLLYSVFTRLGVRRRVAWHWMWIVPGGYCFLLQAGSIGNDLFAAPLALAAVDFALRARSSRAPRDFFTSILAAALMTGDKGSGLPLLLPWALAILPSWPLLLRAPGRTAAVCVIAVAVSFLPNAVLNSYYIHDWSGNKTETTGAKNYPALRVAANVGLVLVNNLTPPVFPLTKPWDRFVKAHMPASLSVPLHQTMVEPEAAEFKLSEMQIEENAGIGFGVTALLIVSVVATIDRRGIFRRKLPSTPPESLWLVAVRLSPWVSLMALLSQSAIAGISRIVTPYYPLIMIVFLLAPGQEWLVKRVWWRALALGVFLMAGLTLIISPARPLFPAQTIFRPGHALPAAFERAATVYTVYHDRHDAFAPALTQLPPDVKVLGLFTYDDPEVSLWLPYGSRRIVHVRPEDTAADLKQQGIQYILIHPVKLRQWFNRAPEDWVRSLNATVTAIIPLRLRAGEPSVDWWLVRLP